MEPEQSGTPLREPERHAAAVRLHHHPCALPAHHQGHHHVQTLALCKDGVKILNYARGELVNTEALLEAMETGKVSGYMTDFPSEAILGKPGIVCTPHLALPPRKPRTTAPSWQHRS